MAQIGVPLPEAPSTKQRPLWMSFLMGCGILSVAGCCVLLGFFGYTFFSLKETVPEAKAFLREALPAVAQPWDAEQMHRRSAHEEFNTVANWEKLFKRYRAKLGSLKSLDIEEPTRWYMRNVNGRISVDLEYAADFEKVKGTMSITVHKAGDRWVFWRMSVHSAAFETEL